MCKRLGNTKECRAMGEAVAGIEKLERLIAWQGICETANLINRTCANVTRWREGHEADRWAWQLDPLPFASEPIWVGYERRRRGEVDVWVAQPGGGYKVWRHSTQTYGGGETYDLRTEIAELYGMTRLLRRMLVDAVERQAEA